MNLIFFFILAFNDGTFVIERWPTIEICKQQASARELTFRGGGYLARSPIGVSECAQEVPTVTRHEADSSDFVPADPTSGTSGVDFVTGSGNFATVDFVTSLRAAGL